jgi:hypothetical protein
MVKVRVHQSLKHVRVEQPTAFLFLYQTREKQTVEIILYSGRAECPPSSYFLQRTHFPARDRGEQSPHEPVQQIRICLRLSIDNRDNRGSHSLQYSHQRPHKDEHAAQTDLTKNLYHVINSPHFRANMVVYNHTTQKVLFDISPFINHTPPLLAVRA